MGVDSIICVKFPKNKFRLADLDALELTLSTIASDVWPRRIRNFVRKVNLDDAMEGYQWQDYYSGQDEVICAVNYVGRHPSSRHESWPAVRKILVSLLRDRKDECIILLGSDHGGIELVTEDLIKMYDEECRE